MRVWLVDAMLSDETRLALANICSTVSDGSAAHCFRGPGSLLSQWAPGNSMPEVKGYLGFTLCYISCFQRVLTRNYISIL